MEGAAGTESAFDCTQGEVFEIQGGRAVEMRVLNTNKAG